MTKLNQIYKCNVCGNIVEVTHTGAGELVCCGQAMELQTEKNQDEGQEKHVPVIEKTDKGYKVRIGEVAHPMEENHFIEWIELITDENIERIYLKPNEEPIAEFESSAENISARCYCNVHGLWTTKN